MSSESLSGGPLDAVVVVDLGQQYNAPYATLLLALAGAKVIKVEPPGGEGLRRRNEVKGSGAGLPFYLMNSNKHGITLNLKDPRGKALLLEMLERAEVLVENYRPGVMDRLGLGADELCRRYPALVYASGSGYGQSGAYRDMAAMDLTVQAMSGVMASTGFPDSPPVKAGPAIADFFGGVHLYGAIVTALYRRSRTGRGTRLDVAMLDAVLPALMSNIGALLGASTPVPERTGNRHGGLSVSPYNVYPTKDGYIAVLGLTDVHWASILTLMNRADLLGDERYATMPARVRAMDEVDTLVADWTSLSTTDEVFGLLRDSGVTCAPVRTLRDVLYDPHLRQRGMVEDRAVPGIGTLPLIHSPLLCAGADRVPLRPAPALGADNEGILGQWLGRSRAQLDALRADGVI